MMSCDKDISRITVLWANPSDAGGFFTDKIINADFLALVRLSFEQTI